MTRAMHTVSFASVWIVLRAANTGSRSSPDLSMFGDTRFSAGGHSVVLKMEEQHSAELKGWNLSRASVSADFLKRIAREKQLQIRNLCEGCADVPLTLTKFSAELRRLGATCTEAS